MAKTVKHNGRFPLVSHLVHNIMTMRKDFMRQMFDPRRSIDDECGYPSGSPTAIEFRQMFDRNGVAARVVDLYPDESWQVEPEVRENDEVEETDFERAFNELQKTHNILHYIQRADRISGIGRFGIILFGLDDGKQLDEPVDGFNEDGTVNEGTSHNLTFIRTFDESLVSISQFEQDPLNPRFGLPVVYDITFLDPRKVHEGTGVPPEQRTTLSVHWSRVVHLADNRQTSEILGDSRMLVVWNRLLDLEKILGGSGEMYWRGAFPGISLESQPGLEDIELDIEATKDDIELYMNSLQRYLLTTGMTARSLAPQIASPEPHVKTALMGVTIPLKVPYRVFVGSEQASLASTQDIATWRGRMNRRNREYTAPLVVKPVVQRLIDYGVLDPPSRPEEGMVEGSFVVEFPDLNAPGDVEKIDNAKKITEAIAKYVQSGASELIPEKEFLTMILDFSSDEADSIIENAMNRIRQEERETEEMERIVQRALPDNSPEDEEEEVDGPQA